MPDIEQRLYELGTLDALARRDGPFQRLAPASKLIVALVYIVAVVSYGRYELQALLPLAALPLAVLLVADLPLKPILGAVLAVTPFAILVGIFNPILDRAPYELAPGVVVAGGWVSFASILLRFALTISTGLILVTTTGFHRLCGALVDLKVPRPLAVQLLLLYRYIFVLVEDAIRVVRARDLRGFGRRGRGLKPTGALIGSLLIRTLDRARRIHAAMCARGFDGRIPVAGAKGFRLTDGLFLVLGVAFILVIRLANPARLIGTIFLGAGS